jgi:hypothetical protein
MSILRLFITILDKQAFIEREARTANMGIYASVAGRYKLGGRISRHQYFSISRSAANTTPA